MSARDWRSMDDAPMDGTVIDACARYKSATAGFPRYVHFLDGEWRQPDRGQGEPLVCWAWRPRTEWPPEGVAATDQGSREAQATELNDDTLDLTELRRVAEAALSATGCGFDARKAYSAFNRAANSRVVLSLIARLEAETAARVAAEGALEPFVELADETDGFCDEQLVTVRVSDCRRARALLHSQPKAEGL